MYGGGSRGVGSNGTRAGARRPAPASVPSMELPDYAGWRATCDTLHAHTQVLGSWPPCSRRRSRNSSMPRCG